jgi:hypothetical protein
MAIIGAFDIDFEIIGINDGTNYCKNLWIFGSSGESMGRIQAFWSEQDRVHSPRWLIDGCGSLSFHSPRMTCPGVKRPNGAILQTRQAQAV